MIEIGVRELKERLDRGEPVHLVDVREPEETAICRLPGAEEIPMLLLFTGAKSPSAPKESEVVLFCHHGMRSFEAARFLRMRGWKNAVSLRGGIDAWAGEIDPGMRRY